MRTLIFPLPLVIILLVCAPSAAQNTVYPFTTTTDTATVWPAQGSSGREPGAMNVVMSGQGFRLSAYLAGAWLGNGLMRTQRAALPGFPLNQPYHGAPWIYPGTETLDSVPSDVVDWLFLELRSPADCTLIIDRQAVLLREDGRITDPLGNEELYPTLSGISQAYIVIDHLSHMPVMTASPVELLGGYTYDLSDTLSCPLYGGGQKAAVALSSGVVGLVCGDINLNKQLKYSGPGNDRNLISQRIFLQTGSTTLTTTTTGYFPEDLSMDGVVKYSGPNNDAAKIIQNLVVLTGSTAIVVVHNCPVPDGVFAPCTPQPDQANAGPDSLNIAGDSIVLYANTPSSGTGSWSLVPGPWSLNTGFSDSTSAISVFYGQAGVSYTLVWTISTVCGSSSDTVLISFLDPQTFKNCGDTLIDTRDGKAYPTTQIGTQCWMAANLNAGNMVAGVNDHSNDGILEKYCYNDNPANCDIYGGLYTWDEAMQWSTSEGSRGVCPQGWFVPATQDWDVLTAFLGGESVAGGKLKKVGLSLWLPPNQDATDEYAFGAVPGGNRNPGGFFGNLGANTTFWVSSLQSVNFPYYRDIGYNSGILVNSSHSNTFGFAVRCVWDTLLTCTPQPDQADAGPDSLNIPGDSIVLYANIPSSGTGIWSLVSGPWSLNTAFSDSTSATSVFHGQAGQTYQLVWAISTVCGTSTDTVVISFAPAAAFSCSGSFTDSRDGQSYPMVHIGNQCWMGRNLNVGQFTQSIASGSLSHTDMSDDGVIQKYCYANDQYYCDLFGGLYEWDEMMGYLSSEGIQGICPDGWHLPSDSEWTVLTDYLGGLSVAGGHLKDASPNFWSWPNTDATNASGFTTLPGGRRYFSGSFSDIGDYGLFWCSTPSATVPQYAIIRSLGYQSGSVNRYDGYRTYGLSVRCISNADPGPQPPVQANAGPDSLGIVDNYITLYGNYPMNGSGLWTILSGQGGSFYDSTLFNTEFYGDPGVTYTLVWTITTSTGSSSDTVLIGFALSYPDCGTIYDWRDGRMYETVVIGTYCWMKQNLNYGNRINSNSSASNDSIPEKYCYNDQDANCDIFGGLYSWDELMNYAGFPYYPGLCPYGWHVPVIAEWNNLQAAVAGDGNALKEIGQGSPPSGEGTNASGFSALLGGTFSGAGGTYQDLGTTARFYSSSSPSGWPTSYWVLANDGIIYGGANSPGNAYSVRCVQDY